MTPDHITASARARLFKEALTTSNSTRCGGFIDLSLCSNPETRGLNCQGCKAVDLAETYLSSQNVVLIIHGEGRISKKSK